MPQLCFSPIVRLFSVCFLYKWFYKGYKIKEYIRVLTKYSPDNQVAVIPHLQNITFAKIGIFF